LLIKDSIPWGFVWVQNLSIFHYAFEALLVNEVRYLTLFEEKYGIKIEVPGAAILSIFGFDATAFWHDVKGLSIIFGTTHIIRESNVRCFYYSCLRCNACITCGEKVDKFRLYICVITIDSESAVAFQRQARTVIVLNGFSYKNFT
jgi:hypothetical protein